MSCSLSHDDAGDAAAAAITHQKSKNEKKCNCRRNSSTVVPINWYDDEVLLTQFPRSPRKNWGSQHTEIRLRAMMMRCWCWCRCRNVFVSTTRKKVKNFRLRCAIRHRQAGWDWGDGTLCRSLIQRQSSPAAAKTTQTHTQTQVWRLSSTEMKWVSEADVEERCQPRKGREGEGEASRLIVH